MKKITLLLLTLTTLGLVFFPLGGILAQTQLDALRGSLDTSAAKAGIPTDAASKDLQSRIGQTINYLFGIIGSVFLALTIVGGVLWMMAGGSEDKVSRAKRFITGGIEGLLIIFMAYALVYVVLAALQAGANNS